MTTNSVLTRASLRKSFGSLTPVAQMPNLIEVQKKSYDLFLQKEEKEGGREAFGLQGVFEAAFPIKDYANTAQLEFLRYDFEPPKYDVEECRHRGMTYEASLKLTLRLVIFDVDAETGKRQVKAVKEQSVYMGEVPLMTDNGTFVVNGAERVVVSQMHRSPGVFFAHDKGKTHASGKLLFAARIIPYRGSWLDLEFDAKDIVHVRIDRRRKLPATVLLRVLGMSAEEILGTFYGKTRCRRLKKGWVLPFVPARWRKTLTHDLVDAANGKVLATAGTKINARDVRLLAEGDTKEILLMTEALCDPQHERFLARNIPAPKGHEGAEEGLLAPAGAVVNEELVEAIEAAGLKEISLLDIDFVKNGPHIRNTLFSDKCTDRDSALREVYRVMRPGDPPVTEAAEELFNGLFFDAERYDLSAVGRVKLNMRLGLDAPDTLCTLRLEDIVAVVRILVDLRDGKGEVDDIDNLGNRRVRSVGELIENQYRIGLKRMERAIRERMSAVEIDTVTPQDLVNAKPVTAMVREFFGSSQLSQFMDQTNPLSEVTHKRRLSALGPGGLTRERAGFEVRDVHPTHYGRICPVETPEGPNIGLINSLASYARINKYGLIESPYRCVREGRITDEVVYLSALEEARHRIAQAKLNCAPDGTITDELVNCRVNSGFEMTPPADVDLMDVSPKQIVSIAAALIPFLENDDANRALMGSNMQRQAVPLLRAEAPLVGTGIEDVVARDSGAILVARRAGIVDQIDAKRIFVRASERVSPSDPGVDIYNLRKFQRSNQSTCINQRPLVHVGQEVTADEILADGPGSDHGELALGRNVLVAFMPWNGYNFEDSILISERVVHDDVFTSIHIEAFDVHARDTKLGPEEITRDIPNVGEEALRHLDEVGIVYVGARVEAGDVLVGKTTPKSEAPMTPEEKLLRAIFGEKASEVRDTSLRLPPGASGTVVEVRIFNRHGVEKDERALSIEREEIEHFARDRDDEMSVLARNVYKRLVEILVGNDVLRGAGRLNGAALTQAHLDTLPKEQWWKIRVRSQTAQREADALKVRFEEGKKHLDTLFMEKSEKVQRGDDLPPGVMKVVKVFVAVKRKVREGDKMAGRHGNKGVISKIAPIEDMPYLEDGTSVDIVLNPLGVPSRMNVGQILETHLGWACAGLGRKIARALEVWRAEHNEAALKETLAGIYGADHALLQEEPEARARACAPLVKGVPVATPVFDGAHEKDIHALLEAAGLDKSGQEIIYDGRTGEAFGRPVTIGYIYMLKLHHLVDDKIHARSIGPYSLVTQQPLGGKAQFGGQRFGEMEVWALEAYGAGYTLQEMLTLKSDDVAGRTKTYEAIVQGEDMFTAGVPESFNVLVMEMRALGLNIALLNRKP